MIDPTADLPAWVRAVHEWPLSAAVRESEWIFPILQTLHIFGLVLLVGVIAIVDLRLLGVVLREQAPERFARAVLPITHAGFGLHWWPTDDTGRRATADGSRGQFAYVDRDLDVVVVKTSRWPYDDVLADRQYRDLSYLGLEAIARAAGTVAP